MLVLVPALLAASPARAAADQEGAPQVAAAQPEAPDPAETPIPVPPLTPTGFLVAWKPMLLTVRVDNGSGATFGSDKLQALRFLGRYTFALSKRAPFVGRVELEGGEFRTDAQNGTFGSNGYDFTLRGLAGAATRISPGFTVLASGGLITRYQHGYASGGAPTVGLVGVVSNIELEFMLWPYITLSLFAEGAITPYSYNAQVNLGRLSDASELRGRVQLSFDLSPNTAIDVGYDFTRWYSGFSQSTITGNLNPDRAFFVEQLESAVTVGLRLRR
ncbi:MAG TPA: hypothetical protein VN874_11475 [Myxococcales bacterium]|jgi:hypothetical protein|nr:hypothetical protein [Myxococcales bacterium]